MNEGLRQILALGYEYVWVNYNDARYEQIGFLDAALSLMEKDPHAAMVFPYWKDNTWVYGRRGDHEPVIFCGILGFVVRRGPLAAIADHPRYRLEPLWDSSNFSNHDNILATFLALYEQGFCVLTDRNFTVTELTEAADAASEAARGFSAQEWKSTKGPADFEAWYARTFPELTGTYKEKRAHLMRRIEQLIRQHNLATTPVVKTRWRQWLRNL